MKKSKLYPKKILKKEVSIKKENIIIWVLSLRILDNSFIGKNPPDDINVKARFSESKDLIEIIFKIINISNVSPEYSKKILTACLTTSELFNEI